MKHLLPNSFICIFLRCLGNGKSPTNLSLDDSIIDIYVGSIVIVAGELLIVFSVAPSLIRLEGNARGDDLINPPPIELCLYCANFLVTAPCRHGNKFHYWQCSLFAKCAFLTVDGSRYKSKRQTILAAISLFHFLPYFALQLPFRTCLAFGNRCNPYYSSLLPCC